MPAAICGIIFGLTGMAVALIAIVLIGLITRQPTLLAGGLLGLGGTWFVLLGNAALLCARPGQVCGGTPLDMVPWLAFSAGIVFAGILAGWFVLVRARSR